MKVMYLRLALAFAASLVLLGGAHAEPAKMPALSVPKPSAFLATETPI